MSKVSQNSDLETTAKGRRGVSLASVRSPEKRLAILILALSMLVVPAIEARASQAAVEEYRAKAAFIYHFMQLVEWPDNSLESGAPIHLCTIGGDPFHGELETAMEGKMVHNHRIRIQHLKRDDNLRSCEIVFLDGRDRMLARRSLDILTNHSVLTIGEGDTFLQDGGIIRFCNDNNKLQFEINLHAARAAQLKVSSRLLLLAKTVTGKSGT